MAEKNEVTKRYYNMFELARELGVGEWTLKEWRKRGTLGKYVTKLGGKPIITIQNLDWFLNAMPAMNEEAAK